MINLWTMSSCDNSVCNIAAYFHFFFDTLLIPDVNSQRIFGQFKRCICFLRIEKFTPLTPWHCIKFTWWIRFETTALFTHHERWTFRSANLMQNTCDDSRTIIAPILSVEILYEITEKYPISWPQLEQYAKSFYFFQFTSHKERPPHARYLQAQNS